MLYNILELQKRSAEVALVVGQDQETENEEGQDLVAAEDGQDQEVAATDQALDVGRITDQKIENPGHDHGKSLCTLLFVWKISQKNVHTLTISKYT